MLIKETGSIRKRKVEKFIRHLSEKPEENKELIERVNEIATRIVQIDRIIILSSLAIPYNWFGSFNPNIIDLTYEKREELLEEKGDLAIELERLYMIHNK